MSFLFHLLPGRVALGLILALMVLCTPDVHAAQPVLLVFGDSLSAAYGMPRERGWVALLQQARPDWKVMNASISAETTSGGLRRFDAALAEHRPNIVVLELGANDGLRGAPLPDIEANLARLMHQARDHHAKVVLVAMRLPPNYGLDYSRDFATIYPRLAKRERGALTPFLLQDVPPEQFQADNLHPTAEAQPRILNNVMQVLRPLLGP